MFFLGMMVTERTKKMEKSLKIAVVVDKKCLFSRKRFLETKMAKKHFLSILAASALILLGCSGENSVEVTSEVLGPSVVPERVGPVSQYGQLMAGAPEGQGRIYGSCEGVTAGKEVQVRGMSLYWSVGNKNATQFYTEDGIKAMVRDMNIEIVRAAIGTSENWGTKGYILDSAKQQDMIRQVVNGAVKSDIYVIFDWHSHTATDQIEDAKRFFEHVASEYGNYDNVIFEVFNEPKQQRWDAIRDYADTIINVIRKYSDNLILVGNPYWDQTPHSAIGNEVHDPLHNVAYTFHYYANTHRIAGEGLSAEKAMEAGLSVFVSEWGTGNADGGGTPDLAKNSQWQDWVNQYKLSAANWSASTINEGTAAFVGASTMDSLVLSTSGALVKEYLSASNPASYTKCAAK